LTGIVEKVIISSLKIKKEKEKRIELPNIYMKNDI
jgi:hypothetical protein